MGRFFWVLCLEIRNISKWDVSNVTNMEQLFLSAKFTGDISEWNVEK